MKVRCGGKLRTQYSISTLLLLPVLVALVLLLRPTQISPAKVHEGIRVILDGNLSDQGKLKAISRYVSIGDTSDEIESVLGQYADFFGHGPGFFQCSYSQSGLVIAFYPDGISYGIGYYPKSAQGSPNGIRWLSIPDSVTGAGHMAKWVVLPTEGANLP